MRAHVVLASVATLTVLGVSAAISPAGALGYSFVTVNSAGGDGDFTQLLGINNGGTIAGYFGDGKVVPNNGFTVAPPYGAGNFAAENFPGAAQTQVTGVNNVGTTVGFFVDAAGDNVGFVNKGGVFTPFFDPNSGIPIVTQLLGVNDSNLAVGFYVNDTGVTHADIVDVSTSIFNSATITLPASFDSTSTTATGINNDGTVSGFYTNSAGNTFGFLVTEGGDVSLNDPNGNGADTMALGLNNKDQVVGSYVDAAGNTHGFVYNSLTNTWTTIDDPNADGTTSFGVEGTIINGINDKGQFVGFYANTLTVPDAVNGFLANPVPEPSTWAMMIAGFAGLGLFGYRASRQCDQRQAATVEA